MPISGAKLGVHLIALEAVLALHALASGCGSAGGASGDAGPPDAAAIPVCSSYGSSAVYAANYPAPTAPASLGHGSAVADFTCDGRPEVIAARVFVDASGGLTFAGELRLFGWQADGTPAPGHALSETMMPSAIASGDFDGDGHDDLVVSGSVEFAHGRLVYLRNLCEGDFAAAIVLADPSPYLGTSMEVADVDSDGVDDLVLAGWSGSAGQGLHVLFGGATPFARQVASDTPFEFRDFAVGDLNGDHHPDVAALVSASGGRILDFVRWLVGDGAGGFVERNAGVFVGDATEGVVIANLDGDPRGEILVPRAPRGWTIVEWADAGALEEVWTNFPGVPPLHTLDLDDDGDLDVISHDVVDDTIDIWRNRGIGEFGYEAVRAASCGELYPAADYAGDGLAELLCGDSSILELYAGACTTPPPRVRPASTLVRPCAAGVSFEETAYSVSMPKSMRIGDITGDGRPDVLLHVVYPGGGQGGGGEGMFVLRQALAGGGELSPFEELPNVYATGGFVLADLDGDGTSELVTTSGVEGWSIVRDDMLGPSEPVRGLGALSEPLAGDFDGDGRVDLAFVRGDSSDGRLVVVPAGDASAAFEIGGLGSGVNAPLAVDLDHDGGTDIVVTTRLDGPVSSPSCVLWSPLTASSACVSTGVRNLGRVPGEVDGDARADLVRAAGRGVAVARQLPGRMFEERIGPMLSFGWIDAALGNFVGTSALDFVVSTKGGGVAMFEGVGSGVPPAGIPFARETTLVPFELMQVVDLDGDGRDDVVGAGQTATGLGELEVLRACPPTR